ncbi:MAG: cupredoxin domain-containing protein [Bdellovibrionales bacterium]|nr:cupredoxin domain-containing protein [Bdellovibrionales bacterium]
MKYKTTQLWVCLLLFFTLNSLTWAKELKTQQARQRAVKVDITDVGFRPSKIQVNRGENIVLLVTRKTDKTCIKELKRMDKSGVIALPLNKEVEFKLGTMKKAGEVRILCGMNMLAGVIQVN